MADGAVLAPLIAGAQIGGAAIQVLGNFALHEMAVLVAALVGRAFDVEVDPTGGGVAVGGAEGLNGLADGPIAGGGGFVEADAFEPSLTLESAALADGDNDIVLGAAWR